MLFRYNLKQKSARMRQLFLFVTCFICVLKAFAEDTSVIIDIDRIEGSSITFQLNEPTLLRVKNQNKRLILFSLEQSVANASVELSDCDTPGVFHINSPDTYRQPEIFALNSTSSNCALTISASASVDRFAITTLSWVVVEKPSPEFVLGAHHLTKAGYYWDRYFRADDTSKPSELKALLSSFASASQQFQMAGSRFYSQYADYKKSEVFHFLGDYKKQAETLNSLIKRADLLPHFRTHSYIDLSSHAIYETREYSAADFYIQAALDSLKLLANPILRADALETKVAIEVEQGRYNNAIDVFVQTYETYLSLNAKKDATNTALSLGYFHLRNGDMLRASQEYNSAKLLAEQINDDYSIANAHIKLATVYRNLGNFDKASEFIDIALKNSTKFPHSYLDAWAKIEKANILLATMQYDYAIGWLQKGQLAFQQLNVLADAYEVDILLASIYISTKKYEKAREVLSHYLDYAREHQTPLQIAKAELQFSQLLTVNEEYSAALQLQKRALAIYERTTDAFSLAEIKFDLAATYATLGELEQASVLYTEAQSFLKSIDAAPTALDDIHRLVSALSVQSPIQALQIIESVLANALSRHDQLLRDDLRAGFLASVQELVSLRIRLDNKMSLRDSLTSAENVKADVFKRSRQGKKIRRNVSIEQESELSILNQQMTEKLAALQDQQTGPRKELLDQLRTISEERFIIERRIYYPEPLKVKGEKFDQTDLSNLQEKLTQGQLVYFVDTSSSGSHAWFITDENISYHSLPSQQHLEAIITQFLFTIKERKLTSDLEAGHKLVNLLFPETDALLGKNELVIIADGPLANLPFSALPSPINEARLLNGFTISFHQSLKMLLAQLESPTFFTNNLNTLIVANPTMLSDTKNTFSDTSFYAANLPFSAAEGSAIEKTKGHNPTLLVEDQANKAIFKALPLDNFDIMHFATHAVANSELPELGGLVLSNKQGSDNLLLAPEIKLLNLNTRLVVLSGCETTLGKTIAGEGMLGLSRAFMQAGARNVIGSLWRVQDDATAKLMAYFYNYLLVEKQSPQLALVNAQKDIRDYQRRDGRRPWRAPYYWSGFVLHGNGY